MVRLPEHVPVADAQALRALVRRRLHAPVMPGLTALAEAAVARHGGAAGVRAVLAYGSTLRDASLHETLADLYVLTADFGQVSRAPLARLGCRLVPPNVHHLAIDFEQRRLQAKYAVLPLAQFARRMRPQVRNPYFWARFAQPSRLVWSADEAAAGAVEEAVMRAVETALTAAVALQGTADDWRGLWQGLLAATYRTELRVESGQRAAQIVAADEEWYRGTVQAVFGRSENIRLPAALAAVRGRLRWWPVMAQGKWLTVLRLAKAAFTFAGGADYIAFKIERHTGERIELREWQRRHPLLAGVLMLPKLLRKGVVK